MVEVTRSHLKQKNNISLWSNFFFLSEKILYEICVCATPQRSKKLTLCMCFVCYMHGTIKCFIKLTNQPKSPPTTHQHTHTRTNQTNQPSALFFFQVCLQLHFVCFISGIFGLLYSHAVHFTCQLL